MSLIPHPHPDQVRAFVDYLNRQAQGQANAKTAREICCALELGKNGDRLLRALAHAANESGYLVCTGNAGYWLPASPDEAEETIGRLHSQGLQMLQRAQELRALVNQQFIAGAKQLNLDL